MYCMSMYVLYTHKLWCYYVSNYTYYVQKNMFEQYLQHKTTEDFRVIHAACVFSRANFAKVIHKGP